jgi:hypothetical protein
MNGEIPPLAADGLVEYKKQPVEVQSFMHIADILEETMEYALN